MRVPLAAACAVALLTVGCNQYYRSRPGALGPAKTQIAPGERALAWQHAIGAVVEQGYIPVVLNESGGFISAKRREDLTDDALIGSIVTVVIAPEGTVRVELSGAGFFSNEQDFLDAVTKRQAKIMQAIVSAHAAPPR